MTTPDIAQLDELIRQRLDVLLPQKLAEIEEGKTPSITIIATRGTLDWAYPPFILASTAAALGWNATIFFTFYGLNLLLKDISGLKVSPTGNPAMPMKMPFGPKGFQKFDWGPLLPNALINNVPSFENLATALMKKTIKNNGVADIAELRMLSQEADVKFIACQMTVDLFGFHHDDFIDGLEYAGAATALPIAQKSDVTLFM